MSRKAPTPAPDPSTKPKPPPPPPPKNFFPHPTTDPPKPPPAPQYSFVYTPGSQETPTNRNEKNMTRQMEAIVANLEQILAIETLEYHDMTVLAGGPKSRSETKIALLKECIRVADPVVDEESQ